MMEFDFTLRPDLGGTTFSFVKEISRDRITYLLGSESVLTKVTIPGSKDFFHITVETNQGDRFLDVFYDFKGHLTSANIWFRRYCNQKDFNVLADPGGDLLDTYDQLFERGTDIMFEADIDQNNLGVYYCLEESTSDNLKVLGCADNDMPQGEIFVNCDVDPDDDITPVDFYSNFEVKDDLLSLGIKTNEHAIAQEHISTVVNVDKVDGRSTPADIKKFLDSVFLKSLNTFGFDDSAAGIK